MSEVVYREICPYPEDGDRWKDITINAGASQSTLQDIKLPETAGCFTYRNSRRHIEGTSNRFIYWRTSNDVIELVEVSLDVNLRGNRLRLRFQHTPILQGISIHETSDYIVVLVATVSTIHKLRFMHPRKLHFTDHFLKAQDAVIPSIFFDASIEKLRSHSSYHVLNHASLGVPLPHTSCSWLLPGGEAAFVVANSAGSHLLVVMTEKEDGKVMTVELKRTSVMSRLWNGFVRSNQSSDVALSIVCHQDVTDTFIFSLCRDLRIRMWSQNRQECLMMASVFEFQDENGNSAAYNAQQCFLKKSVSSSSECYLGVYVSLPQQNQFLIFQPLQTADQYRLSHIATLCHKKHDLVDFCVTLTHVWTLWLNSDSEPVVRMTAFDSDGDQMVSCITWLTMDLEPPVSRNVFIPLGESDPREAYLKEIFRQGRFSSSTISKAISIYRRTADTSFSRSSPLPKYSHKEDVTKTVENEIFARSREAELSEEEYQELQAECWDKFLSYCIQYHEVGTKPLGLSYDPTGGYILLIKKSVYSILRPCDPLEQLISPSANQYSPSSFCINLISREDSSLYPSLFAIFQCLAILRKFMTEDMIAGFEQDLSELKSPDDIALQQCRALQALSGDAEGCILLQLQSQLNMATSILPALKLLLQQIDLSPKEDSFDIDDDVPPFRDYPHFLNSSAGISSLCEGVSQYLRQRFAFCRDLLLLETLVSNLGGGSGINMETAERIQAEVLPQTRTLVQIYFALKWCTECEFVAKTTSVLETELKQLSLLDLPDVSFSPTSKSDETVGRTIVYFFLADQGKAAAYSLLASQISYEEFCDKKWSLYLPQLITNVIRLLWPLGPYFSFPEFLLTQGQYVQLQGYIRLVKSWCEWNSYSLLFLSANCFLILGEHLKALNLFVQVAEGVEKEEYLLKKIMQGVGDTSTSVTACYYMKVIQLFEHFELSDCIIKLAMKVIGVLDKNDPHIPTFWSLVFKHHLELGHNEEAYTALTRNPDTSRQKDCLRQMIVVLCERKQFQTLIEFPYVDMQDDVVNILESRARSSDLLRQNFYDLLYSFHIHKSNFRKAASIMFEYGMRLGQEVSCLEGLQKQASCYLVTVNCLNLVDPKYAWIVKPVPKVTLLADGSENENPGMSPKRNVDGDEIEPLVTSVHRSVEVLEISDIRRECELIQARLLLAQKDQHAAAISAASLSASDCIALLVSNGLFETAVGLCESFSLEVTPVFEGLTYRCIRLMQQPGQGLRDDEQEVFEWLAHNNPEIFHSSSYMSAQEQMWYILKHYLEKYEEAGQTKFHRCVVSKLLSFGVQVPAWLKHSYQKHNPAQLLYLYISYGLLENATDLAVGYMDALLKHGMEDFGLQYPLQELSPAVWLPHTYIDALLDALEDAQATEVNCSQLYQRLREKIERYNEKVKSVSDTILMMAT